MDIKKPILAHIGENEPLILLSEVRRYYSEFELIKMEEPFSMLDQEFYNKLSSILQLANECKSFGWNLESENINEFIFYSLLDIYEGYQKQYPEENPPIEDTENFDGLDIYYPIHTNRFSIIGVFEILIVAIRDTLRKKHQENDIKAPKKQKDTTNEAELIDIRKTVVKMVLDEDIRFTLQGIEGELVIAVLIYKEGDQTFFVLDKDLQGNIFKEPYVTNALLDLVIDIKEELEAENEEKELTVFKNQLLEISKNIILKIEDIEYHGVNIFNDRFDQYLNNLICEWITERGPKYSLSVKVVNQTIESRHYLGFMELFSIDNRRFSLMHCISVAVDHVHGYVKKNIEEGVNVALDIILETSDIDYLADLSKALRKLVFKGSLHPRYGALHDPILDQIRFSNTLEQIGFKRKLENEYVSGDSENGIILEKVSNNEESSNDRLSNMDLVKKNLRPLSGQLHGKVILKEADFNRLMIYVEALVRDSSIPDEIKDIEQMGATREFILRTFYNLYYDLYGGSKDKKRRQKWCEFIKSTFRQQFMAWEISTISGKFSASNCNYDSIVKSIVYDQ